MRIQLISILSVLGFISNSAFAAPKPPLPGSPPPPGLPIDGGLIILLFLAVVLGIYKIYNLKLKQ